MSTELATLVALQDHDTATDQARHRLTHLPEQARVDELVASGRTIDADIARLTGERDVLAKRQEGIEREITACRTKQADLAKRLTVTSVPKVAETLQHESAMSAARQRGLEDDELAVMEELEPIESALAGAEARRGALGGELAGATEALGAATAVAKGALDDLLAARVALAEAVPAALVERYEALRPRLGGVAVARLVGGHCSGCNLALSTAELQRLRSLPPDQLDECEQCGRLLVH